MEDRYYIIEKNISLESKENCKSKGLTFLVLSSGKTELRYITGDRSIAGMVEVKNEKLISPSNYQVLEVGELQFEVRKEQYKYQLKKSKNN